MVTSLKAGDRVKVKNNYPQTNQKGVEGQVVCIITNPNTTPKTLYVLIEVPGLIAGSNGHISPPYIAIVGTIPLYSNRKDMFYVEPQFLELLGPSDVDILEEIIAKLEDI